MLTAIKDAIQRLEPPQPPLALSRMALRLLVAFAILGAGSAALCLVLLDGKSEWLQRTLVTAAGPFAGVIQGHVPGLVWPCVAEAIVLVGLAVSLAGRRVGLCRIVGYLALVVWFLLGWGASGIGT